ncbi:hypothetical protein AB1N83_003993 [Pleurotus pulmonarius]
MYKPRRPPYHYELIRTKDQICRGSPVIPDQVNRYPIKGDSGSLDATTKRRTAVLPEPFPCDGTRLIGSPRAIRSH